MFSSYIRLCFLRPILCLRSLRKPKQTQSNQTTIIKIKTYKIVNIDVGYHGNGL